VEIEIVTFREGRSPSLRIHLTLSKPRLPEVAIEKGHSRATRAADARLSGYAGRISPSG
jgi:hypothetical protein